MSILSTSEDASPAAPRIVKNIHLVPNHGPRIKNNEKIDYIRLKEAVIQNGIYCLQAAYKGTSIISIDFFFITARNRVDDRQKRRAMWQPRLKFKDHHKRSDVKSGQWLSGCGKSPFVTKWNNITSAPTQGAGTEGGSSRLKGCAPPASLAGSIRSVAHVPADTPAT
ncbi:unnamed protein product [Caenorhabditis brenneri]